MGAIDLVNNMLMGQKSDGSAPTIEKQVVKLPCLLTKTCFYGGTKIITMDRHDEVVIISLSSNTQYRVVNFNHNCVYYVDDQ